MNARPSLLAALALVACSGAPLPRTTTAEERASLLSVVSTLETGLAVALATGKIPAADHQLAMQQVGEVRAAIAASETVAVTYADLLNRVAALAAVWAIAKG